jgi:hypothetical protein
MKYIKLFEINEYTSPPLYKKGDYVRISPFIPKSEIYEIVSIEYGNRTYDYWLRSSTTRESYVDWVEEHKLELVPEYEVMANKYNL